MKWDYSNAQLSFQELGEVDKSDIGMPTENQEPSLFTIFFSLKQMQEENQSESRRTRLASKKLQGGMRKINKTCGEIVERLTMVEGRTESLEVQLESLKAENTSQGVALADAMSKTEDQENRQRQNNLRFLGIPEGLEGNDPREYMMKLLRGAFPDKVKWDWDMEIQRAHRFPLMVRKHPQRDSERPRAWLVYFGNYLLRQLIYDKAHPNAQKTFENVTFSRPDFVHATVERRWRLRQLINPFQRIGTEVYLQNPARLQTAFMGHIRSFTSKIQAQEYLSSISQGASSNKL